MHLFDPILVSMVELDDEREEAVDFELDVRSPRGGGTAKNGNAMQANFILFGYDCFTSYAYKFGKK